MTGAAQQNELPVDFRGKVRLFPLPSLVMFPHVVQPLHVFEPRYREMLEESLDDDQLLAMALLQPGWQEKYDDRPAVYPVICIGRIVSHTRLEDGSYNLLLQGVRRATIVRELAPTRPFRQADVAVLEDLYPAAGAGHRTKLRRDLFTACRELLAGSPAGLEQFEQLAAQQLSLGMIADIIAFSLHIDLPAKQHLLTEWNVDLRTDLLIELLRQIVSGRRQESPEKLDFPPDFSRN